MPNNATITSEQLRTVFLATELGGNTRNLNHFSYAQTGESTYTFGLLQFDVGKNGADVQNFLKENGFTADDISELSQHGGLSRKQLDALDTKLQAIPQEKIDQFTNKQLDRVIARADKTIDLVSEKNPAAADAIAKSSALQLAIADYDNQFHISDLDRKHLSSNGFVAYLQGETVTLRGGTIRAEHPLSREDVQKFIDKTKYGVAEHKKDEEHDAAKSRANRLDQAIHKLGLGTPHTNAQQPSTQNYSGTAHVDGTVKGGANNQAIHDMQANLAKLGYKDGHGQPLQADGHFGLDTGHAVERFQHDHHLTVDGIAGPKTLAALHARTHAAAKTASPGLDDPKNPDHKLYEQALAGVRKLDAEVGRVPNQHSANLAAALVVAAKKEGITRIDDVALSTDNGASVFAVQHSAVPKYAQVPTLPSLNTPIEQSSRAAQQVNPPQTPPPMQTPSAPTQNAPSLSL